MEQQFAQQSKREIIFISLVLHSVIIPFPFSIAITITINGYVTIFLPETDGIEKIYSRGTIGETV
jgi:hypothetical protein